MKTLQRSLACLLLLVCGSITASCGPGWRGEPTETETSASTTGAGKPTSILFLRPTASATRSATPRATATRTTTVSASSTALSTLAYLETAEPDHKDWQRYFHKAYQFYFSAPGDWRVSEWGSHIVQVSPPGLPEVKLTIGVKFSTEEGRIARTGVPEGDIVPAGTVHFMGLEISKGVLVYEGRDKVVLYNNCIDIPVGGRVFTLCLDDFSRDYEAIDLPEEVVRITDEIVASFSLP